MSYKLEKPYTEKQRADFIVENNHNKGLRIEETDKVLYALEAWEEINEAGKIIDNTEEYEAEQAEQEKERIARLYLTAADVERAIYKAKGMDFDDIIALVEAQAPEGLDVKGVNEVSSLDEQVSPLDVKALKIELKANNFYRGNAYIDTIGTLLGFTSKMLDKFFETNDYKDLIQV